MVSANGADVSTAAAQTRAVRRPACAAAANSRSTSSILLTSVGTGVASPPAAWMPRGDAGESVAVTGRENDVRTGGRQGPGGGRPDAPAGAR